MQTSEYKRFDEFRKDIQCFVHNIFVLNDEKDEICIASMKKYKVFKIARSASPWHLKRGYPTLY